MLLRSTLVELGCFGDPALDMKTLLSEAWEDYHAWCKENKVHPGQGRFTPGLVSWQLMISNLRARNFVGMMLTEHAAWTSMFFFWSLDSEWISFSEHIMPNLS